MKTYMKYSLVSSVLILLAARGSENNPDEIETIAFADASWDSIRVHNHIAGTIIEAGFGYDTEEITGSTAATVQGLREGSINVYMEIWKENIREIYEQAVDSGDAVEVATNFADNEQGLFVPTYVIE